MAKIKICGMKRSEDIDFANKLNPDFIGFILSDGFKRSIKPSIASELAVKLNSSIKVVGVFVNEPIENTELDFIDIIQLHGNESPEYCSKISKPLIKALTAESFERIEEYEPYVDYFLFDSGCGTGKVFDWSLIPKTKKPFFLAGGLSAENLAQAIDKIQPYSIDVSSSVETDGKKDFNKMKDVINIVRSKNNG
ncbi:MAG: phosphoribosylanthranilate isomerase [Clostridiales bacterium]|nr:phosphoribosylanthranilate isomerase [Clostridiales bacterium]